MTDTKTTIHAKKPTVRKAPARAKAVKTTGAVAEKILPTSSNPLEYMAAIGKRKTAVASIKFFTRGSGKITINGKTLENFFFVPSLQRIILKPLELAGLHGSTDAEVRMSGGGMKSQALALRLALTRAIVKFTPETRPALRGAGFLTRDARKKERKKYGLKKARKAPQWAKR